MNKRYGHLFRGRFKSVLVENDAYRGNIIRQYGSIESRENIKKERFAGRPELGDVFAPDDNKAKRNKNILKAFRDYGHTHTQTQVGEHFRGRSW